MDVADEPTPVEPGVSVQVGVIGLCLLVQTWLVEYDLGSASPVVSLVWLALGVLLLWGVHQRRSQVARGLLVLWGLLGLLTYAGATLGSEMPLLRGLLLVAAFGGQALVAWREPLASHCRTA